MASSVANNKPYERIEAREDGYLWLVGYDDNNKKDGKQDIQEQQPLLLHAAESLLKQLKKKWHENVDMVASDDDEEEEEEEPDDDDDEDGEEEEQKDGDVVEEAGDQNGKPPETKESDENETKDEDDDGPKNDDKIADYTHLTRATNLGDRIQTTLAHIRLYKHSKVKSKKNYKESRMKALEHQRDRLQKQKDQQQQQQQKQNELPPPIQEGNQDEPPSQKEEKPEDKVTNGKEEEEKKHDEQHWADEFQLVGEGKKKKSGKDDNNDNNEDDAPQDPMVRLVRTINSIRALTPVLLPLLFHKDQTPSKGILVGPKQFTKVPGKSKKARWWLLGTHVFDWTTVQTCRAMHLHLQELLEYYLPHEMVVSEVLKDAATNDKTEFWCNQWLSNVWTTRQESISLLSPYDILVQEVPEGDNHDNERQMIMKRCQACDKRFFGGPKASAAHNKAAREQKQYEEAVRRLASRISTILERDFPGSRLSVYGSCLSNLSLKASDVDLSLFLPQAAHAKKSFQNGSWEPAKYEREMSKLVRDVNRRLARRQGEFRDMIPVTKARVPVVKGSYILAGNPHTPDGSLHFDICFLNDIAVANSMMLREYSLMDDAVKELMVAVKKWAKENNICSAQDNTLSSYAWLNMVIFYLQCLGYIPNLQSKELMKKVGHERDPNEYWHNVNDLDTFCLTYEQAKQGWKRPDHFASEPISHTALLYGFFHFYAIGFQRSVSMVSIKRGSGTVLPKTVFRKCSQFFCIEDPFETFDSHMPHDLGIPVNEVQTRRIFRLLDLAEQHLRERLLGIDDDDEVTSLWPVAVTEQKKEAGDGGGKKKKKKKGRGGPGKTSNQQEQQRQQPNKEKQQQQQQRNSGEGKAKQTKNAKQHDQSHTAKPPQRNQDGKSSTQNAQNHNNVAKAPTQAAGQNPSEKHSAAKNKQRPLPPDAKKPHNNAPKGAAHNPGRGRGGGRGAGRGGRGGRGGGREAGRGGRGDSGGAGRGTGRRRGRRRGGGNANKANNENKQVAATN